MLLMWVYTLKAGKAEPELGPGYHRSRDRMVVHFPCGPGRRSRANQLILSPKSSVEQEQVGVLQRLEQGRAQVGAARNERAGATGGLIANDQLTVCPATSRDANREVRPGPGTAPPRGGLAGGRGIGAACAVGESSR